MRVLIHCERRVDLYITTPKGQESRRYGLDALQLKIIIPVKSSWNNYHRNISYSHEQSEFPSDPAKRQLIIFETALDLILVHHRTRKYSNAAHTWGQSTIPSANHRRVEWTSHRNKV